MTVIKGRPAGRGRLSAGILRWQADPDRKGGASDRDWQRRGSMTRGLGSAAARALDAGPGL
jgi:hypothetical protein